MTTRPKIIVSFRLGREEWARRMWWAVPRVGDCVILGAGKDRFPADHNGDAVFVVKQVTWGSESKTDADADWQGVICHIEHLPEEAA